MEAENEVQVNTEKPTFEKPELKILDVKGTQTAALPNPTESPFHFQS